MSYLTLPNIDTDTSKVVISFWFLVPKESADKARKMAKDFPVYRVLHGIVPLITWGEPQLARPAMDLQIYQGNVSISGNPTMLSQLVVESPSTPMGPSYIGVNVGTPDFILEPTLEVNIQTKDYSTGVGVSSDRTSWTGIDTGFFYRNPNDADNPYWGAPIFANVQYVLTDNTNLYFTISPDNFGARTGDGAPKIDLDQWHHLLISWDLPNRRMWCAIDDVNLTGVDLPALNDPLNGDDPNQSWSSNEFGVIGQEGKKVTLSISTIPTNPINIPGPGRLKYPYDTGSGLGIGEKEPVVTVAMAEFLMWTDVTLDTSIEENRRHFITSPNEDGKQFPTNSSPLTIPYRKFAFGDPATWEPGADNPAFAPPLFDPSAYPTVIKGLGAAQVDFTKCSFNWMMGRNLGKAKGKTEKTGKIKTFWPAPNKEIKDGSDPILQPKPGS